MGISAANEGDARAYDGFSEEIRASDYPDEGFLFSGTGLLKNHKLGRLRTTTFPPTHGLKTLPDGTIVDGCNVENASYPAGTCAERVALGAAVVAGHREFAAVAIATDAAEATPPCGICRQALAEFAPGLAVVAIDATGRVTRWSLADLLPNPFTPASLHR